MVIHSGISVGEYEYACLLDIYLGEELPIVGYLCISLW